MKLLLQSDPDASEMVSSKIVTISAAFAAIVGTLCLIGLVLFSGMPVNHDCALYLQCAQLLLNGDLPYVDYVEINLPLIQYIHVLPVSLAQWLDVDVAMTFQVFVMGIVLYSAAMMYFVPSESAIKSTAGRLFLAAAWLCFSIFVFASGGFGQREHLFLLGYMPYLSCRVNRYEDVPLPYSLSLTAGLIGSISILIKPHFTLLAIAVELFMLYRRRRFSALAAPEVLIVTGFAVTYAIHFLVIPVAMRDAFFLRWIPLIVENYHVYNNPISVLYSAAVLGGLVLTFVVARQVRTLQVETLTLSIVIAAGLFYLQQKGWLYHLYPVVGFLIVLLTTVFVASFETPMVLPIRPAAMRLPLRSFVFAALLLGLLGAIGFWSQLALLKAPRRYAFMREFVPHIQKNTERDDRVAFISTSVVPAYPTMIYADRLPGTRYLTAFPIAMFYKDVHLNIDGSFPYHKLDHTTRGETQFLEELGNDVAKHRLKLAFIQTSECQACPEGFRIDQYLYENGWQEKYLRNYELMENVNGFAVYRRVD